MNLVRGSIIIFSIIMLAGCTYFSSAKEKFGAHDKNYLAATSIPPLKIPPGIGSSAFQNLYPVPDRNYPASNRAVSPVPPGLMAAV